MKIRIPVFEKPINEWTDFEFCIAATIVTIALILGAFLFVVSVVEIGGWMVFVYLGLFLLWLIKAKHIVFEKSNERNDDQTNT